MSHAPLLRTRILALDAEADPATLARIALIPGVTEVRPQDCGHRIALCYDLQRATLTELEPHLTAAGLVLSRRRLHRLSRGWAAFQDDNIRSNARLRHQCCCTPPDAP
ncbi:hypothetical protein [Magnetospirillum fulvum]|uniref:Uncharacterized protein n=1 Tax=Magnetospirillum fulvum TaxID=1082 RepID=A0A1H6HME9_MAGFU|nr:hypothetical protein [Magnetospirillum fulvum]SEH35384.1 hypothetical protein SAMN04244559_01763 [Magnetospirillum fulvum]